MHPKDFDKVYLSIQMSDGTSGTTFMDVLVQPIKQGIIELLNDSELNKSECKYPTFSLDFFIF